MDSWKDTMMSDKDKTMRAAGMVPMRMASGGVRYVQVDQEPTHEHQGMSGTPFEFPPPPKGSPPPRRVTATEQEPTHEYRAKRNEIRCRVCGALRANPIHF